MCLEWAWKGWQDGGLSKANPLARGCFQSDGSSEAGCTHLQCGKTTPWVAEKMGPFKNMINPY